MKKVLGSLCSLLLIFAVLQSFTPETGVTSKAALLKKAAVNFTVTSTGGCSVHIVGQVDYSIIPPSINGFSGTVTISGPKGCPNLTMAFAKTSTTLNMSFNNADVRHVTQVTWSGSQTNCSVILNDANVNASLVAALNALN